MLIRISKKCWVRADDITKIAIYCANQIGNPETSFNVCINAGSSEYHNLFNSFEAAEKFAEQLVEKINSEEWY